jgi:L-ascorbate metabolism protein UlaG (beta-lactamase superfamily)
MKSIHFSASHLWVASSVALLLAVRLAAQESPTLLSPVALTNGELALRLSAPTGLFYRIDAATELPAWQPFQSLLSTGLAQPTDSAAPYLPQRFYRAQELTGSNLVTGDYLPTTNGPVIIHPINHASVVFQWNDLTIYVDPVGGATPYKGLPKAGLILITHEHSDHFDTATLGSVRATNAVILATRTVYNSLTTTLKPLTTVMTNGVSTNLLGLSVEAIPAYNLSSSFHPKGNGNGYLLTIGGRRIYVSGDTEDTPAMHALREIDVAFLAMNQPYSMTIAQALSAVREFQPRVVYPEHYRNSNGTYADLAGFKRQLGQELGIEVRLRKWY